MNKIVSTSLIAVGSFLLGGSLGLYFGGKKCEGCKYPEYAHFYRNIMNADFGLSTVDIKPGHLYSISELKEILDSMPMDGDLPDDSPYFDMAVGDTDGDSPVELSGFQKGLEEYNNRVKIYFPQKMQDETLSPEESLEEIIEQDKINNSDITEPYIISFDAYMNEYEEYSKNTLTYFEGDDVLCDERNEILTDVEDYIGDEALVSFGEGSDDENVVYVRNHRKSSDYEIIREEGSYEVDILGMDPRDVDNDYENAKKFFGLNEDQEE